MLSIIEELGLDGEVRGESEDPGPATSTHCFRDLAETTSSRPEPRVLCRFCDYKYVICFYPGLEQVLEIPGSCFHLGWLVDPLAARPTKYDLKYFCVVMDY